jgi:hypothetical protein
VILLGSGPLEPILANAANDPCVSETHSGTPPQIGGAVGVGAAQAQTVGSPTTGTAGARVADVGVNLGPTLLPLNIAVEGINASSSYYCQGTTLSYAGSSQVAAISINGLAIAVPDPSAPVDIDLGDILTIHLNQTVVASVGDRTEVTRRSVFIESKLNTVRAMPRPRTVTVKGLVAQAPGTMPGEMPAIEPEGTGTVMVVTVPGLGVGMPPAPAQGLPATPARASPRAIWVARSFDSMKAARLVTSVWSPVLVTSVWLRCTVRMSPRSISSGALGSGMLMARSLILIPATWELPAKASVVPWQK